MNKTFTWSVVVVIIIIALIVIFSGGGDVVNAISVDGQAAGESLLIGSVTLASSGYVVIHADNNGEPGDVIGTSELLDGENSDVRVNLSRSSLSGETLYAMLHTDDGDGEYNFPGEDVPTEDEEGNVVIAKLVVDGESMGKVTIVYTDEGYEPAELTVSKGETVTFVNNSSAGMWTATAVHPTHTVYPGSDIADCGETEGMFDSCKAVDGGEEWSFTFDELGEWGYHNHVSAGHFGRVIVE